MDEKIDQQLSIHSSNQTRTISPEFTELNKKRKLQHELDDSCPPLSKQKIHNQQLMEEEEEENRTVSSFFKSETNNSSMNKDWASTSSSSYTTNEISSSNSNSIDSGIINSNNYQLNMVSDCKKGGYNELEEFDDPVMAELIMKNGLNGSDEDQLDAFLYSNGLNEFAIPPVMQYDKRVAREPTIDQEFEQYFSSLML